VRMDQSTKLSSNEAVLLMFRCGMGNSSKSTYGLSLFNAFTSAHMYQDCLLLGIKLWRACYPLHMNRRAEDEDGASEERGGMFFVTKIKFYNGEWWKEFGFQRKQEGVNHDDIMTMMPKILWTITYYCIKDSICICLSQSNLYRVQHKVIATVVP